MRTRRLAAPAAALTMLLSGCGIIDAVGDGGGDECQEADQPLVDDVMSQARSDFTTSKGLQIDRVEFTNAATVPLPIDQQRFGVTQLMGMSAVVVDAGKAADTEFAGIEHVFIIAIDDGSVVGAVDTFAQEVFDLPSPDDPDWESWSVEVDESPTALDAFGCVNPSR